MNKFGAYISSLMTTVIDTEQEEFVKQLAWDELKRINADIEEFLRKHSKDDIPEDEEKPEKQLLQEDK
tara:strand:+ start:335 stop:538 length:204 start_codon:yes stop_codon:yes gene_type:complete